MQPQERDTRSPATEDDFVAKAVTQLKQKELGLIEEIDKHKRLKQQRVLHKAKVMAGHDDYIQML